MLLQWSVLSANINESVGMAAVLMITDLFHHIGFFLLQFCLELYKQHHKRLIQVSKVLRKQIATHTKLFIQRYIYVVSLMSENMDHFYKLIFICKYLI